jgi:lipopolysaccharide transport system permease protein
MVKENILVFADFVRKLFKSHYLLKMMAVRELRVVYVGSFFGFAWMLVNPLFLVLIYGLVFGVFFKSRPDPAYGVDNFFIFLLCGIVPWQFFSQTLSASANTIISNRNLIKKAAGFPSEILPVTTLLSNVIGHLVAMILLFVIAFAFGIRPGPGILFVFVYMFLISILCLGLGWIISGANVFARDVQQILGLALMGWFFLTPIIYSPSMIPDGWFFFIFKLNPMFHAIEGYRFAFLTGKILPLKDLAYMGTVSFLTLGIGGFFFRKIKPWFAEVL